MPSGSVSHRSRLRAPSSSTAKLGRVANVDVFSWFVQIIFLCFYVCFMKLLFYDSLLLLFLCYYLLKLCLAGLCKLLFVFLCVFYEIIIL